ncbi:protein trapped in endoderm-1-like [Haliotis rubra]|uniref:protein trapped in endoderm-1-like n=1 Tax=Haliotis rubra TaxID=36100 RepID=UPI001EE53F2A|nr:protein trapped in endoderm-1-like [Haliotis rubra]
MDFNSNITAQIVFNCLFAIGIIVGNLVMIGIILSNKELRQNSKYVIVLFLALADLFVGTFPLPMWTHLLVTQELDVSCLTMTALYGSSLITVANSCFAVIALNVDFILQCTVSSYQGMCKKLVTCMLVAFFILGPIIVLVPIMIVGQSPSAYTCALYMIPKFGRALVAMSYWVPSAIAIITTVVSIALHQKRRRLAFGQYGQRAVSQPSTNPAAPVDIILVSFLTVALFFPSKVMALISYACFNCSWYLILSTVMSYLSYAKSVIVPFLWFLNKDFRSIVKGRVRSNTNNQQTFNQPPHYYTHQQYVENPGALSAAYPNNSFSPVVTGNGEPMKQ